MLLFSTTFHSRSIRQSPMSWSELVLVGSFCAPIRKFLCNESGNFQPQGEILSTAPSPSFIIQSPCKRFMYCTVETADAVTSQVMSFRCTNFEDASFEFLSAQPAGGGAPCFLSVDTNNSYLLVSNYYGGNLTVFPIDDNGVLFPFCQEISFCAPLASHLPLIRGSGHTHQTVHLSQSPHVLLCELGQNAVYTFAFTSPPSGAGDVLRQTGCWVAPPGSGPRHLVLHPSEQFAYVLSELACTVTVLKVDPATGTITSPSSMDDHADTEQLCSYSTLREHERRAPCEAICAAEVLLSADALFLYASNRDVEVGGPRDLAGGTFKQPTRCSIAVFAVLDGGSSLQHLQQVSARGCHPRAMSLLNRGTHLAVANKDEGHRPLHAGGNLVMFPVDRTTGLLLEDQVVVSENMAEALSQPTWIHSFCRPEKS